MKHPVILTVIIVVLISYCTPLHAQSDPVERLNQYIAAVNNGNYRDAYEIFLYPRSSYRSFADGWKYTQNVEAEFGEFSPVRRSEDRGDIPALLISTLTNGTIETYQGCYFMIAFDGTWYVEDFSFRQLFRRKPTSSDIRRFTLFDCSTLRSEKGLTIAPLPQNLEAAAELRELGLPVFRIGYKAVVTANNVAVRDKTTSAGRKVAILNRGDKVTIIDGPLKSVRFVWWKVQLDNNIVGWVAALSEDGTQLLDLQ